MLSITGILSSLAFPLLISWFPPQAFTEWNKTELDSFLIEITANILKFKDADGTHLLPKIRDSAGQKGTGKWTAISALEYGTPVTLIGETERSHKRAVHTTLEGDMPFCRVTLQPWRDALL